MHAWVPLRMYAIVPSCMHTTTHACHHATTHARHYATLPPCHYACTSPCNYAWVLLRHYAWAPPCMGATMHVRHYACTLGRRHATTPPPFQPDHRPTAPPPSLGSDASSTHQPLQRNAIVLPQQNASAKADKEPVPGPRAARTIASAIAAPPLMPRQRPQNRLRASATAVGTPEDLAQPLRIRSG
jgi:hypothetical protein